MDQVCFNNIGSIAAYIGMAVTAASTVANFVPAPDKLSGFAKLFSRILHFVAVDVVTAKK